MSINAEFTYLELFDNDIGICHYGALSERPLENLYSVGTMTLVILRPLITVAIIFGLFGLILIAVRMGFNPKRVKVIKYLGSLHLAVLLLASLAILLSVATILESKHGTEYIMRTVYRAAWFEVILIGIWINIFFATVLRFPFRRSKLGFFLTHCGILTILIGSLMTRLEGQEGTITLEEGKSSSMLNLQGNALELKNISTNEILFRKNVEELSLPFRLSDDSNNQITVTEYHPHSSMSHIYRKSLESSPKQESNPAIEFSIRSSMFNLDQWLVHVNEDLRSPNVLRMGPAKISLEKITKVDAQNLIREVSGNLNKGTQSKARLSISHDNGISVTEYVAQDILDKEIEVGQGYKIKVTGIYRNASVVKDKGIVDQPGPPNNPAIVFMLTYPDGRQRMSVRFQLHPEFQGIHAQSDATLVEPQIQALDVAPSKMKPAECRFLVDEDGEFYYHITSSKVTQAGILKLNKMVPMGWNDAVLVAKQLLPDAAVQRLVMPAKLAANAKSSLPMTRVKIETNSKPEIKTLLYGESTELEINNEKVQLIFGAHGIELPFEVKLKDFRKIDYPNTSRAMEYESDVEVKNLFPTQDGENNIIATTISMNNVLDHSGWRFFQSSYRIEGDKEYSTFQVAKDPGIETIYLGSIVMVLGIGLMFWGLPGSRQS